MIRLNIPRYVYMCVSDHTYVCTRAGRQFQDLPFYFPDGIVFGLVNHNSRKVKMNPPPGTIVEAGDEVLIVRPTVLTGGSYHAATKPAVRDTGAHLASACTGGESVPTALTGASYHAITRPAF